NKKLCVLVWYYHDDDLPGAAANVDLQFSGLQAMQGDPEIRQYRIDADHSNATTVWQQMGSPEKPTDEQLAKLKEAGQLTKMPEPLIMLQEETMEHLGLKLPRQGVSLVVIQWPKS